MSCGDYDSNALKREATKKDLFVPNYLKRYINIKKVFPKHKYTEAEEVKLSDIKKAKSLVGGMTNMLSILGLRLEGWHHSGVDDSINIARICLKLMEDGFEFN